MRLSVRPGGPLSGTATVPGDKSIAHRWLMLAAIASGQSRIEGLPSSLDVRSSATVLAKLLPHAAPSLEAWAARAPLPRDAHGFTSDGPQPRPLPLLVEGRGRASIEGSELVLDCGNSGTTLRLMCGLLASHPGPVSLTGDESLRRRPMERVARPLRELGADVRTHEGHAPVEVRGGSLSGLTIRTEAPSAQVKGALLLAAIAAKGLTTVWESAPTRDHTERALAALGADVACDAAGVSVGRFDVPAFSGSVPGDPSSAAFLLAASALTGGEVTVEGVGLNPTRLGFLAVMSRMGIPITTEETGSSLGEPFGRISVGAVGALRGTAVSGEELPLVVDEVPVIAALAAHARGETRFEEAGELRVKESDRLLAMTDAIRATGGEAAVEGETLIVAGGGLSGGVVHPEGDHRIAMAMAVAGLASRGAVTVEDAECAEVSFPGFASALRSLGADVEG